MANTGLRYSRGPFQTLEAEPASTFSKGDLLMYDSNSSLSGMDMRFPSGEDIAGVALADSVDSIAQADGVNRVPFVVPKSDTYFLSDSTADSRFTAGTEVDIGVDSDGRPVVVSPSSATTARAVIQRGTETVQGQSTDSRVEIGLIEHAGDIDHA